MKRALIILTILLCSIPLPSAKEIEGIVTDTDSIPIEFANVTAFANDSVVGGGITDASGLFNIKVGSDCNRLRVSFVGYDDAFLTTIQQNMGRIVLHQTSTTLQEVVVKAPLIRREADRIVLNVAANPLTANKDAQELLKTAPGVWATDESLSIYGQSGTAVYIDDRKVNMSGNQLMTYLKSIQSSSIATIEIIPKGGAEYSADLSGGIIKINLKRNRVDGLTGVAGLNLTAGEYKQWINPFVNLSLHNGKWTININGNVNGSPSDRYTSYEESTNAYVSQEMFGVSCHKKKVMQGNVSLGVFYEPTDRDKIGLQFDYSLDKTRHTSNSETEISGPKVQDGTFGTYESQDRFHNLNVAFNWSHTTDKKGSVLKLVSNYNYQHSSATEDNVMRWSYIQKDSVYNTDNRNRYNIFMTDFSFRKVFNTGWNLNVGAKYTFNNVSNRSFHHFFKDESWVSDTRYDFDSSYDENIAAVYVTANVNTGRWKFKAGIRGEYSGTNGGVTIKDRFDIFPNANISYNLTEKGDYTVAVGYYRNIRRPSFHSLNPIVRQVSDYTYTVGNQELVPSLTDAVSLDFVLAGRFTVAAGYSMTYNPIRQMFASNPEYPERLYLTWGNEGKDRNIFIHGDGFINITKWWNLYSSLTYMITSQKLTDTGSFDTFGYLQLVASTTFTLPRNFNLTMSCFYNSKMKIGNITVFPILNLNPTLQKQFGQHWSVSVGVENILQRKSKIRTESSGYNRLTYSKTYVTAKIGVTYKFNSGKRFRAPRIEKNTDNSRFSKE
ncbi:MAG: TonB-dependent receptor family protein [Candidatus Homeothermus sp.]|nr:TonB-dependent receptor family protein [Candidatus Homeothermus sp.]